MFLTGGSWTASLPPAILTHYEAIGSPLCCCPHMILETGARLHTQLQECVSGELVTHAVILTYALSLLF